MKHSMSIVVTILPILAGCAEDPPQTVSDQDGMKPEKRKAARRVDGPDDQADEPRVEIAFTDLVKPQSGRLSAYLFENKPEIPQTLFFDIEVAVASFEYDGETYSEPVRLEGIDFAVRDWHDLANRDFTFPKNPEQGYVDGSLYLGDAHNPADLIRVSFSSFEENTIEAELSVDFDFTFEGNSDHGTPSVVWKIPLEFDSQELDEVFTEARETIWRQQ